VAPTSGLVSAGWKSGEFTLQTLVFLTDLWGTFPSDVPPYPVLWALDRKAGCRLRAGHSDGSGIDPLAQVLRPVDNPQVFRAAALDRRLSDSATSLADEVERLQNHAFTASGGEIRSPLSRCLAAQCVIQVPRAEMESPAADARPPHLISRSSPCARYVAYQRGPHLHSRAREKEQV
jgi:hypothetical protein